MGQMQFEEVVRYTQNRREYLFAAMRRVTGTQKVVLMDMDLLMKRQSRTHANIQPEAEKALLALQQISGQPRITQRELVRTWGAAYPELCRKGTPAPVATFGYGSPRPRGLGLFL
ncbi:MAG TPA: hypothetical protein VFR09_09450 [Alphaproteobacteria bacterium]|nr:hypothetical protein [Alphaproteobacteria bacterium]